MTPQGRDSDLTAGGRDEGTRAQAGAPYNMMRDGEAFEVQRCFG